MGSRHPADYTFASGATGRALVPAIKTHDFNLASIRSGLVEEEDCEKSPVQLLVHTRGSEARRRAIKCFVARSHAVCAGTRGFLITGRKFRRSSATLAAAFS